MAKNNYATKTDVKYLSEKIDGVERRLKDEMVDLKVEVLGELKKIREDNAAHQFSHMRINEDLIDHDKRLRVLESPKI